MKPLRQAQVEREQSIRHSKSGPSRSHSHAAAILAFLPIFLPHQMVWLPKSSKFPRTPTLHHTGSKFGHCSAIFQAAGSPAGTSGCIVTFLPAFALPQGEGFSAFAPYRARHCPIRNSYILALLAQHFPILTSYPQFHLSIPMNMDFLSSSHAHSGLLLMRTPTPLYTFHINTQAGSSLVAPFAVDLDFIPMKKQKIPINDENS